jgi:putative ABC transport system permease protein
MKYLIDYSVKNLMRNKRRTFLTLFAITVAIFIFIVGTSYFGGVVNDIVAQSIRENGHIVIQKKTFTKKERMLPLDENIDNLEGLVSELKKYKQIKIVTPRLNFGGMFMKGENSYPSVGYGLDEVVEKDNLKLDNFIVSGKYFTGAPKEIIIGVEIAKALKVNAGNTINLLGRDSYGSFAGGKYTIIGITDFGTAQANRGFYMSLKNAYRLLKNEDCPQKVICILDNFDNAKSVKSKLLKNRFIKENGYDVFVVDEIGIFQTIFKILQIIIPIIFGFFLIIAMMTIINTMMMTVLERTAEIGVLQAMGLKPQFVGFSFLFETLCFGIMGSILGAIFGTPLVYYFSKTGINIGQSVASGMPIPMKSVIYPSFNIENIILIIFSGILISLIAGILPAIRAIRLRPAEAIREGK